jgi:hypothetical protein
MTSGSGVFLGCQGHQVDFGSVDTKKIPIRETAPRSGLEYRHSKRRVAFPNYVWSSLDPASTDISPFGYFRQVKKCSVGIWTACRVPLAPFGGAEKGSNNGESQELPPDEITARAYPPIEAVPLYGPLLIEFINHRRPTGFRDNCGTKHGWSTPHNAVEDRHEQLSCDRHFGKLERHVFCMPGILRPDLHQLLA